MDWTFYLKRLQKIENIDMVLPEGFCWETGMAGYMSLLDASRTYSNLEIIF